MNRLSSVLAACAAGAVLTLGVAGGMATAQTKPGPEKGSAPTKAGKFHGRFGAKSPAYVARATIRGIKAGRHEIILSTGGRFLVWLDRLCPPLADRLVAWWG